MDPIAGFLSSLFGFCLILYGLSAIFTKHIVLRFRKAWGVKTGKRAATWGVVFVILGMIVALAYPLMASGFLYTGKFSFEEWFSARY